MVLLFSCLLVVLAPAMDAMAQVPPPSAFPTEVDPATEARARDAVGEMSYPDVYQLLLTRGLSEDSATELLRGYDPEDTFSSRDVNELLRRVRPEDLTTRRNKDEKAAEIEAPAVISQALGAAHEPVPFGYDVFKQAPSSFEPDQDLAVGPDYRLGPNDEIRISLWGSVQQEFFGVVDREGNVALPEVGVVSAAGMTLAEFETRLDSEMKRIFSGFKMGVSLRRLRRIQIIVAGDVVRPGAYYLSAVSTAFNALYFAGGPTATGTLRRVRIVRAGQILTEVDLYPNLMGGPSDNPVRLLSGDTVFILPKGPTATIRGEVNRPAIFELLGGETVADLVRMGAGFTPIVFASRATLDRVSPATGPMSIELDLIGLLEADSTLVAGDPASLPLQDGDNLTLYSIYHIEPRQFVEIQGMVQYPGIYPLFPESRVSDLIFRAGGLLDSAYPLRAELSRLANLTGESGAAALTDSVSRVAYIDLGVALSNPESADNVRLAKGDKLYIRKIPGWKSQETVKISGQVVFPGIYPLLVREERLSRFVERAGGVTPQAFLKGASLFREKQGRVIINFERALKKKGDREDIVLVDGDSIHVPSYPPTILVDGEVSQPGALIYQPGMTADYYVDRTGGVTEEGDRGNTRIFRVDGIVQKAFKSMARDPKVEPGSRIVVATKPTGKGVNWGNVVKDSVTIIASLITTVYLITEINNNSP